MEHLDVVVVGAGLSGVAAGVHLTRRTPWASFAVLEAREAIGGTWDLFRYPGIRSDSDMFTLGYSFKPWRGTRGIVDGASIRQYVQEAADENGITPRIRFGRRVVRAEWSSADARWTLDVDGPDGREQLTCGFLLTCTGYYRYDEGYTPEWPGLAAYAGQRVHPQHWPEDLDVRGKSVVVIGSGATAMTLVPALADAGAQVTMLQRTPTYVASRPAHDLVARLLHGRLPEGAASRAVFWKNVLLTRLSYQTSKKNPDRMKKLVRMGLERALPKGYDIDTHFTPPYDPWDQRFCVVPDGDLFAALRDGRAEIVTDTIDTFTPEGIRTTSGRELQADVVVTATGLQLLAIGGLELVVDGRTQVLGETVGYRGMMFSGIPNMAACVGYTNASWTLKCELILHYVTGLLQRLRERGEEVVVPAWTERDLPGTGFIDLTAGYVQRSLDQFPKQGDALPWKVHQDYLRDLFLFRWGRQLHEGLRFGQAGAPLVEAREPAEPAEATAA